MVSASSPCVSHFVDDGKSQDQSVAICINSPRAHLAQLEAQLKIKMAALSISQITSKKKLDF